MESKQPILIAGLGNPGPEYTKTRHNIGFVMIDAVASQLGLSWKYEKKRKAEVAQGVWGDQPVILTKPHTYMNLSGEALGSLCGFFKIPGTQVIAIFDDVTLPFARLKVSVEGGTGGHNGLNSLVKHLGKGFMRFRIGVGGKKHPEMELSDHVLGNFSQDEQMYLDKMLPKFIDGLHLLVDKGAISAMNVLNQIERLKNDNILLKKNTENESTNKQEQV